MKAGWFLLILSLITSHAIAKDFALSITVEEARNIARVTEPVSGGLPLPEGEFPKDQPFGLFEGNREIPVQVLPLVVSEKGTLRWILVDFQTDIGPREVKTFTLKAVNPSVTPHASLRVAETHEAVIVDTGKISFSIAKDKPFTLFSHVEKGGRQVVAGGEVYYVDGFDGRKYVAGVPSTAEVEYYGPMRTTICVKGRFVGDEKNKFLYIARITAWCGRSDVHVKYSLANSNPDHYCYRRIQESAIELQIAAPVSRTIIGASKPIETGAEAWIQQSMRVVSAAMHSSDSLGESGWFHATPGATGPGGARAMSTDRELWLSQGRGDVAEGWLAVRSGTDVIWVTDLYFVEDPPRRLGMQRGRLCLVGICEPAEGAKSPFSDRQRWLFDCSHLSSQYLLDFGAANEPLSLSAKAMAARGRLWAMAPPQWYFETQQLPVGRFGTQADELKCYDLWGWKYDQAQVPVAPAGKAARTPRWVCGDDNHFTSEQDTLEAFLLMYLRTGRRAFFDAAEAWAHYFEDLQTWRTDGWEWKDGGGWWAKKGKGGPLGNRPVRAEDPVTGVRNYILKAYAGEPPFGRAAAGDMFFLANAKACHCHNWGEGLVEWFCLTGDRDAYEAAIDTVEQNIDTQRRAFGKVPGRVASYSRDFTRASFLTHATRLIAPTHPLVVDASEYLASVFLKRPNPEPRGFLNGPSKIDMTIIETKAGPNGLAKMKELGITLDEATGELVDSKRNVRWQPLIDPHTWMFPPLSRAMELYYRITGNEDALDWLIAYGKAVARVLYQEKHGTFNYGHFLVDFPVRGFAWDRTSWDMPPGLEKGKDATVPGLNGYQVLFYPDVAARAYEFCGDPFLKQRAFDIWCAGTHPGVLDRSSINRVGKWVNIYSTHDESVSFSGKTFYIWAHPKKDEKPPHRISDLTVSIANRRATVTFTAPRDEGGGRVSRYQVKWADRPIVDYETFLTKFAAHEEQQVVNWWMAVNVSGEPLPGQPGTKETFGVTEVPENARYWAACAFDDAGNCSLLGNVAQALH
ncbi:MAG: hypothetical protein N2255_08580 [Kiritimatiellae bacterium]|nr:hypothetical protein [Kiritimatiellia bacterium]